MSRSFRPARKRPGRAPYEIIRIHSWSDFVERVCGGGYRNWAFRGQGDARWPLYSTLSRYLRQCGTHRSVWQRQESRILRIFRRKAHHFLQHVPDPRDAFEWLALMQHHGAPTRLLDLTWSPYVAAFFALERAAAEAAVWAFSPPRIHRALPILDKAAQHFEDPLGEVTPRKFGNYEERFLPGKNPIVVIAEPHNMNRRLIAQSGTFVMPGVLDQPVEQILGRYESGDPLLVKFVLPRPEVRDQAMRELYSMNLTYATLFPDLDGLARSMAYELEFHWAFDPRTGKTNPEYEP
jgi:hypothetical protein